MKLSFIPINSVNQNGEGHYAEEIYDMGTRSHVYLVHL